MNTSEMIPMADVSWFEGHRGISTLMRNSGLGLSGAGFHKRLTITYAVGEEVDEARVMKALKAMKAGLEEDSKLEITNLKVEKIYYVAMDRSAPVVESSYKAAKQRLKERQASR